jgi:NAD-reducing hydrogenase large subunit
MKFPYLKQVGREKGWNRVGPLARMNVCDFIGTPLADQARQDFVAFTGKRTNNSTMYAHWARLIEILHSAEVMKELLHDPELMGGDLLRKGTPRNKGIGIIEAPRGTLTHHYEVDDKGRITRCNLIVSTTHNNDAMNTAVKWVAQNVISRKGQVTEGMLNQVEVAIRAYDPCLSCATQALGKMPLRAELFDHQGNLLDARTRNI